LKTGEAQGRSGHEILALLQQARALLSFHQALGIDNYPRTPALENFLHHRQTAVPDARLQPVEKVPVSPPPPVVAAPAVPRAKKRGPEIAMAALRQEIAACRQCALAAGRLTQVLGEGTAESGLLIIADLPFGSEQNMEPGGQNAGRAGELTGPLASTLHPLPDKPFTGQADELLTRMLAAIGLQRQTVYITPLLKCLPAREPAPEELQQCLAVLHREIAATSPQIICTMGPLSARTLLGAGEPLFKLRGRFHRFLDLPLMPTFHPAYLLRNPEMKKAAWHDLQAIQKKMQN
jgi:uracil-DNA glycosylase